jgi:hypothetical protein
MNLSAWPRGEDQPIDFSRTSAFTRHSSDSHSTSSSTGSNSPAGSKSLIPSPHSPDEVHSPSPVSPATSTPSLNSSNSNSRKKGRPLPEELKDDAYWERRRKNNEAAKRSRDARRAKEYEVAIRATILEQENLKLRVEIASLKTELAKLRCLMYPAIQSNRKGRDSCCVHEHD